MFGGVIGRPPTTDKTLNRIIYAYDMDHIDYDLLYKVDSPSDLKRLAVAQLPRYCRELRQYIIEECSKNPGHLASSLGAVELTVAIHYVYDTPHDKLVWDVGHQAYAHKIITGRRDLFPTNRKEGGISGFPRMAESEYDSFGAGHSSTSISAAYGLAKAAELRGERSRVVAVIGDGAMTGGLAFEGLNNAGADKKSDILVILNDNEMAIDQATGALTGYLTRVSTSKRYNRLKRRLWSVFAHIPPLLRICQKTGNAVKQGLLQNSNLFESLNFRYFGQIDGHDIEELVRILTALKDIGEPKLLHVITTKGKGYTPAEDDQAAWHAPGRFNPDTGERLPSKTAAARYQDVFGETLLDLARADERIVGITPARPARALFRRRHSRGTCRDLLGGTGRGRHAPRLQHLFVVHAARVRQRDTRRGLAKSARDVLHRPRRTGGRGRSHAPRSVRSGILLVRA